MYDAAHVWIFFYDLIRGAAHAGLIGGVCILIAPFDIVVFVSEVFHAVVVDSIDYGEACKRNIIAAQLE